MGRCQFERIYGKYVPSTDGPKATSKLPNPSAALYLGALQRAEHSSAESIPRSQRMSLSLARTPSRRFSSAACTPSTSRHPHLGLSNHPACLPCVRYQEIPRPIRLLEARRPTAASALLTHPVSPSSGRPGKPRYHTGSPLFGVGWFHVPGFAASPPSKPQAPPPRPSSVPHRPASCRPTR